MSPLLETVLDLIKNSYTLSEQPDEQWFWLVEAKRMDEAGLQKLKVMLEEEAVGIKKIEESQAANLGRIDQDHLKALEEFKTVTLPGFRKKWEESSRSKENPEELLNSLPDGQP